MLLSLCIVVIILGLINCIFVVVGEVSFTLF